MIKAVILDIDGVILGHQERINFPLPTVAVRSRLQNLAKRLPISLCTVKAFFAVDPIVEACGLQLYHHITDAGATIIKSSTLEAMTTPINPIDARNLIEELRRSDIYTEWYSDHEYFALENENTMIREGRTKLLGREATLLTQTTGQNINKIIALPLNELQETEIIDISKKYLRSAALHWGINPSLLPRMAAFFTNPSATKRTGVEKIAELMGIPLSETLAVGDSTNDWTFMELCGYVGTLGNGTPELKELIKGKGEHGFVSQKTVNEDGLIEILEHFKL